MYNFRGIQENSLHNSACELFASGLVSPSMRDLAIQNFANYCHQLSALCAVYSRSDQYATPIFYISDSILIQKGFLFLFLLILLSFFKVEMHFPSKSTTNNPIECNHTKECVVSYKQCLNCLRM